MIRKMYIECLVLSLVTGFFSSLSYAGIDIEMVLNDGGYESFDHFRADIHFYNDGPEQSGIRVYGILEIESGFYFWPEFTQMVDYRRMTIDEGESYITLLELDFPDLEAVIPYGPIRFWGAWYLGGEQYGYDVAEFWLDPEHKWTPAPHTPVPTYTSTPPQTPTPPIPSNFQFYYHLWNDIGSEDSEKCRDSDEGPVHTIDISYGFYIQATEVTQREWENVFGTNPSCFKGETLPVERVTWFDCCVYCNRLSRLAGYTPCYYSDPSFKTVFDGTPPITTGTVYWKRDANGFRLPTEAEWEGVCRSGVRKSFNNKTNIYNCTREPNLDPIAWYYGNSDTGNGRMTHPVGLKDGNERAMYDMHGNVMEWCWDWYDSDYYSSSPEHDPEGPATGAERVVRGGSWNLQARFCRSAERMKFAPGLRFNFLGFRILRREN